MRDPRFRRTVILLAEVTDEGALGFVINRTTPFTFEDISKDIGVRVDDVLAHTAVHYGGPVSEERGWVLFRDSSLPRLMAQGPIRERTDLDDEDEDSDEAPSRSVEEASIRVGEGIRVSPTVEVLQRFLRDPQRGPFRLLLGYAGWGPDQLAEEISEGSWLPMDVDPDMIFETPECDLWELALRRMGLEPGHFVVGSGGAQA
jgi:putative transcriptional regulator